MKKLILAAGVVITVLLLQAADIRRNESSNVTAAAPKKKNCIGYTIIEFGKGVDCNGDTLKLTRVNGIQVAASQLD